MADIDGVLAKGLVVTGFYQVTTALLINGVDNAANREGDSRCAAGGCFYCHHTKTFNIVVGFYQRKYQQIRSGISII